MTPTAPAGTTALHTTALNVVRRIFDEGFATGNDAIVDELCSADLIEHQFGLTGVGAAATASVKAAIRDVHGAFPDARVTIEDAAEVGDRIWVRVHGEATATGPFFGPPSGRRVDFTVFDQVRVVDGRIVEHWGVPDRFALLAQTGVLNRLAGPAPR